MYRVFAFHYLNVSVCKIEVSMLLNKVALAVILSASLMGTGYAQTRIPSESDIPSLKPEARQDTSCSRVRGYFLRSHYKGVRLDDSFVDQVYDMYFYNLDRYRTLFTESEIQGFKNDRKRLFMALDSCRLDYPYELYKAYMKRRFEKYSYYLEVLKTDSFDFSGNETVTVDTSKLPYRKNIEELRKYWRQVVRSDYLNLRLSGFSEERIRKNLTKRYTSILRNIVKTKNEDAFSAFENAFANAIDPHTSYLSPDDTASFDSSMSLEMEGIGAVLTSKDEYCEIVSIVPGSPSEKSGRLKPKDRIIGVQQHGKNGKPEEMVDVVGMLLTDIVPMVKGPKGSKVTLQIMRGDGASASFFTVDIIRDRIHLEDSAAKGAVNTIDGHKVGVLTVKSFYMGLAKDMKKEIEKMKKDNIEALVVDLRYNGGGSLPEAIDSSGLFFKSGPVVQVRDAVGYVSLNRDDDNVSVYDGPLVVLTNRLSASSSEIFAGVLQDTGRAVIVGDTTFGKGTVQQSRPLDRIYDFYEKPLGSIHYTIAKFYRISGQSTQLRGVVPDIAFPSFSDYADFGENNEPNALPWDQIKPAKYSKVGDLSPYIPDLKKKHDARVKDDPYYAKLANDYETYRKKRKDNSISLNYDIRKAEQEKDKAEALKDTNEYLESLGKPPVKSLDDLPSDFKGRDTLLLEAQHIALDLAQDLRS